MGRLVLIIAELIYLGSFYYFVALIFDIMLILLCIKIIIKNIKVKNNVHFYVTKNNRYFNYLQLWIGKPKWVENYDSWVSNSVYVHCICNEYSFKYYKLNPEDFDDMKVGEIREVFINLED